jgi:GNAT superfamily N-acetyltransferase
VTEPLRIREVRASDASGLTGLLDQLGYPSPADEIGRRLLALAQFPLAKAWLAEDAAVVGLVTCHMFPSIHATAPVAWITTLVVDVGHRGRGIGRSLLEAAESWARTQGAVRISLTAGSQRDGAHAFYSRVGFAQSGVRFTKDLAGPDRTT